MRVIAHAFRRGLHSPRHACSACNANSRFSKSQRHSHSFSSSSSPSSTGQRRTWRRQHSPGSTSASLGGGSSQEMDRPPTIKLAVVGDVHGQWDGDSEAALASLAADVAVFLGDFGEEDTQLIQAVAAVNHPKAVILGNHDAWYSLTARGRLRLQRKLANSNSAALGVLLKKVSKKERRRRQQQQQQQGGGNGSGEGEGGASPAVLKQLEALGADHVGFAAKKFPHLGLNVVGGRPFTKGGRQWSDVAEFYRAQYGVDSVEQSTERIVQTVRSAAEEGGSVVLACHNGPTGLGARRHDICGVDWIPGEEGDHGDPDLQAALEALHLQGCPLPLVLFGHMHSSLRGGGRRNMAHLDPATGTLFLNCAEVPRIREFPLTLLHHAQDGGGDEGREDGREEGAGEEGGAEAEGGGG